MYLKEHSKFCVMHAISPVHAGAGAATGAIDLPVQRERHTGWPHIQASGVKGAFRDCCLQSWMFHKREFNMLVTKEKKKQAEELAGRIFGRTKEDAAELGLNGDKADSQAGAVAFSDARLLAFPVRSNMAPFVWVVCPALLKRLARDLALIGMDADLRNEITIGGDQYSLIKGEMTGSLILEDICLEPFDGSSSNGSSEELAKLYSELDSTIERLVLIPDHHFSFLMETATEVQAQIKIVPETGTTQDGSLRYQELLPADTVFYTVVFFGDERTAVSNKIVLDTLAAAVEEAAASHIQLGGDMTLGRGIFQLSWHKEGGAQ